MRRDLLDLTDLIEVDEYRGVYVKLANSFGDIQQSFAIQLEDLDGELKQGHR